MGYHTAAGAGERIRDESMISVIQSELVGGSGRDRDQGGVRPSVIPQTTEVGRIAGIDAVSATKHCQSQSLVDYE